MDEESLSLEERIDRYNNERGSRINRAYGTFMSATSKSAKARAFDELIRQCDTIDSITTIYNNDFARGFNPNKIIRRWLELCTTAYQVSRVPLSKLTGNVQGSVWRKWLELCTHARDARDIFFKAPHDSGVRVRARILWDRLALAEVREAQPIANLVEAYESARLGSQAKKEAEERLDPVLKAKGY